MAGARVLVVDDEQDLAESCAFLLERAGHVARCAFSAQQALELMAAESFALVVTDVRMPRMSGMDLLVRLREAAFAEILAHCGEPRLEITSAAIPGRDA